MSSYVIEKNIPRTRTATKIVYPFANMEIGDSFLIETDGDTFPRVRNRVTSAAFMWTAGHAGVKFSTRKTAEGLRVWRIS